jgi:DNA-binding CsgD family transcriptional regulator
MIAGRPLSVADYRKSSGITHDYDAPVVAEGLRSVLAVPVMVNRIPRAVLYGACRSGAPIPGQAADMMVKAADRLAIELRVRDEVDVRFAMHQAETTNTAASTTNPEHIRAAYAELRQLAAATGPVPKQRLRQIADGLLQSTADTDARQNRAGTTHVELTQREIDVLALISLGHSNKQAAEHLSLRTQKVKTYLRNASAKLGATSRHGAVVTAHLLGIIP